MDSTTVFYIVVLASFAGLYKIFERAGEKGWKALVPFYNFYVWIVLLQRPKWWIVFFFIPGVNALMYAILMFQTAYAFGRRSFFHLCAASFGCFFYAHYLGFSKDAKDNKWLGPKDFHELKNGFIKSWLDPIFFAIVAASIIRTFFLEAFTIPTSSLEKSLLVGDFLFVNKLSYGSRVPMTPLAFPLAHHTIPIVNSKAYLEFWKLPYMRLPGYKTIKNKDIVVFNYPDGDTVLLNAQDRSYYNTLRDDGKAKLNEDNGTFNVNYPDDQCLSVGRELAKQNPDYGNIVGRPVDKREHYVKRCVAIAGDVLEIKNGEVYINNTLQITPEKAQHHYIVIAKEDFVTLEFLDKNDINIDEGGTGLFDQLYPNGQDTFFVGQSFTPGKRMVTDADLFKYFDTSKYRNAFVYVMNLTNETAEKIKAMPEVISVEKRVDRKGKFTYSIFPHSGRYPWNNDNFGPLQIPKAGMKIKIDADNICLYDRIIDVYEDNELVVRGGKVFINGAPATEYTFKQDYYWMMGDNRHNSADSRSWGYVPFDHVVGTPVFVWFSLKYNDKQPISGKWSLKTIFANEQNGKLRWSRFFCFVSDKGLSKSYFLYFLGIAALWYGVSKFLKFRRKKKGDGTKAASK